MTTVAFVGMTHLGLVSASSVAARGFRTICFDPDEALVTRLQRGELPVSEPGLADQVRSNGDNQTFTADWSDLSQADVIYISSDVPTDDDGASDLTVINLLIGGAIGHLRTDAILIILCQVPPGFTRQIDWPREQLFYQVETLVFGNAIERARNPERYIVGCAQPDRPLPGPLEQLLSAFDCPILPMRYESAELAKISINMCLVASISVANTMAEICEHAGADWSEIAPSLKLDRRIGPHAYLSPGLGIAGGNLERDLATVVRLSEANRADAGVVSAQIANSQHRRNWAAQTVRDLGLERATTAVWGLAYKENTHSVKNSPSLHTIQQLPDARFRAHDPQVSTQSVPARVERVADPLAACDRADLLMILTPWPEYRDIPVEAIRARLAGKVVIDPYRCLDRADALRHGLRYLTLGVGELDA